MKLPELEYQVPMLNPVQEAGAPFKAANQLAGILAEGFTKIGQERIRVQTQEAAATLSERLNAKEQELAQSDYIDQDKLLEELGHDNVPEHVKGYIGRTDAATGQPLKVPMYEVRGALFKKAAQEAVAESSGLIQVPGWAAEFQAKAREHVEAKSQQLALADLKSASAFLEAKSESLIQRYINARDYASARAELAAGGIDPKKVPGWEARIEGAQQSQPFSDALASSDPAVVDQAIADLKSGQGLDRITPEHRTSFLHTLETKKKAMADEAERAVVKAQEARFQKGVGFIANLDLESQKTGKPFDLQRALLAIPMDNSISGVQRERLVNYAKSLAPKPEAGGKDVEAEQRALGLYHVIRQFAAENPEAFAADEITIPGPKGQPPMKLSLFDAVDKLRPGDFKQLSDKQAELKKPNGDRTFLDTEQFVNMKLRTEYHYDLRTTNENSQAEIGKLKIIVDRALQQAQKDKDGKPLTIDERNATIDKTLRLNVKVEKGIIFGDSKKLLSEGLDPDIVATVSHRLARGLGQTPTADQVRTAVKDFELYRDGISQAYEALARKPLGSEVALDIYNLMARKRATIDQKLVADGQFKPASMKSLKFKSKVEKARATAAVQLYLQGER